MYKIGHIGDLHLGYASTRKRIDENGYNVRENDGYVAFERVVDGMIEAEIDMALITGDLFHTPRPKNHTILIAQQQLRRLADAGIETYILAGNHDATDVRMDVPSSKLLDEPANGIYSYSEPYKVVEVTEGVFIHFLSHHAFSDQNDTFNDIKLIDGAINILASHGSTYDTNIGVILRSPNEPREVVIPQKIMDLDWDYTLLGHIHERGWIGSKDGMTDTSGRKQFYSGSLLRRGFSDKPCKLGRGWTQWNVNTETHEITPEFWTIPERPQFDMKSVQTKGRTSTEIEDELIEQLKAINKRMKDEFGEITLENAPIVRQTLLGVDTVTRLTLDWSKIGEYSKDYLVHSYKQVYDTTDRNDSEKTTLDDLANTGDVVAVFKKWNEKADINIKEEIKDDVIDSAENYLKKSRDLILDD